MPSLVMQFSSIQQEVASALEYHQLHTSETQQFKNVPFLILVAPAPPPFFLFCLLHGMTSWCLPRHPSNVSSTAGAGGSGHNSHFALTVPFVSFHKYT